MKEQSDYCRYGAFCCPYRYDFMTTKPCKDCEHLYTKEEWEKYERRSDK